MEERKIKPANLRFYVDKQRGGQKKLADALGVSPAFVGQCKIDGGTVMPIKYLDRICEVLKCTPENLCDDYVVNKGEHTRIVKMILEKVEAMDEKAQVDLYADLIKKYF